MDQAHGARWLKPTSAVNTASIITRGFINAMKSPSRTAKLRCEAKPRMSRTTQANAICAGASNDFPLPFIVNLAMRYPIS